MKSIPNGFQVLGRRERNRAPECTPCYMRSERSPLSRGQGLQQPQNLKGKGYSKNQKIAGVTLLETLLVLAIISVLLIMATRFYSSTGESRKITDANDKLQMIQNAANRWLLTHQDFSTGITSQTSFKDFVERGYLPEDYYIVDSSTKKNKPINNPWGGEITVQYASSVMKVTFTNLFKESSQKLQSQYQQVLCQDSSSQKTNPNITCDNEQGTTTTSTCDIEFTFNDLPCYQVTEEKKS